VDSWLGFDDRPHRSRIHIPNHGSDSPKTAEPKGRLTVNDKAYWEEGRAFLEEFILSKDDQDKEIARLIMEYVRYDWQASIGLVIYEPTRSDCFMRLIKRGKKRRVITELRKRIARRKKLHKLAFQRKLREVWLAYHALPDEPIER